MAEEYKSNSHKSKELTTVNEGSTEPAIKGSVSLYKKQSGVEKFASNFLAEDMRSVFSYLFTDVLVPSFKKVLDDTVSNGIHMLLYGRSARPKDSGPKMSYGSYYYSGTFAKPINEPVINKPANSIYDYNAFLLPTRGAAMAIQEKMECVLEQYPIVTVNDLYEIIKTTVPDYDIPIPPYTASNYGWTNIKTSEIFADRDGYVLRLPRIKEL